jgi:hypothetical protein
VNSNEPDRARREGSREDPDRPPDGGVAGAAGGAREPERTGNPGSGQSPRSAGASAHGGPEGSSPTGPVVGDRSRGDAELPDEAQPKGAIMVTSVVAIAIVVAFFGVLSILMGRS